MFLLLEARKHFQVLLGLEKGLAVGDFLLDLAAARGDGVDDCARFRQVEGGDVLKLAELQHAACFFVAGYGALGTRGHVRDDGSGGAIECWRVGHDGCGGGMAVMYGEKKERERR